MFRSFFFTVVVMVGCLTVIGGKSALAQSSEGSTLSQEERIVAITILAEARGEGSEGMYAVACVIKQRSIERHISVSAVCLQRFKPSRFWQFSCWNDGATVDKLSVQVTRKTSPEVIDYAIALAQGLVAGKDLDRSTIGFANHYCTLETHPSWAKGKVPVIVIGHHKFYKL